MIDGAAAGWLASRREELNRRFARACRRHPRLAPETVTGMLQATLPCLAGDEPGADALCLAVYDLVLLHAGRGGFALLPGIEVLLCEIFPRLRPHLLTRPTSLPAALSNAVENLGARGEEMAQGLGQLGPLLSNPDALLDAGAVLAWRLGETRLRTAALAAAAKVPARALAIALGISDWPDSAASLALAALQADAWQPPSARVSTPTLRAIAAGQADVAALLASLGDPSVPPPAQWKDVARLGDFAGFGGSFERPPLVLDGGDRHRFHVRAGPACFVLSADAFGCVCRPAPDPDLPARVPGARRAKDDRGPRLDPDGTLWLGIARAQLTGAGATSYLALPDALFVTFADSHRIHVFAPWRAPL
jgi:hypothetical protein